VDNADAAPDEPLDDAGEESYLAVDLPDGTSLVVMDADDSDDYLVVLVAADEGETTVASEAEFGQIIERLIELVEPHIASFPIQAEDADHLEPAITSIEDGIVYALVRFGEDQWLELIEEEGELYDGDAFASPVDYLRGLAEEDDGEDDDHDHDGHDHDHG